MEPRTQRRSRVLKDGSSHRMLMVSASVARVGRAAFDPVMLGHDVASQAADTLRVEEAPEPLHAGFLKCVLWQHERGHALGRVVVPNVASNSQS